MNWFPILGEVFWKWVPALISFFVSINFLSKFRDWKLGLSIFWERYLYEFIGIYFSNGFWEELRTDGCGDYWFIGLWGEVLGSGELFWIFIWYGSDPDCYLMLFFFMWLTMKFFAFFVVVESHGVKAGRDDNSRIKVAIGERIWVIELLSAVFTVEVLQVARVWLYELTLLVFINYLDVRLL